MPQRLRLYDFRVSRGPGLVGICREDTAGVSALVNTLQERLLYAKEANEEGWYGTWAEVTLLASRATPYITLPRQIARIELADVCNRPVPVNNQFVEYLRFGNGRMPSQCANGFCRGFNLSQAYSRNNAVTFLDPPSQPFVLQAFALDPADVQAAKRVLFQGYDTAGNVIYSQDSANQITGEYVTLASPFAQTTNHFNLPITGIQKDVTSGAIQIMAVDVNTGVSTLILTMDPGEQTAQYRRYFFHALPSSCCPLPNQAQPQTIPITAIVKLDLIPAYVDQDYLLIQSLEALIEEAQSKRFSEIDGAPAKAQAASCHKDAIAMLNGQVVHYIGKNDPAVNFKPFGSASFNRVTRGFI
jgi:hypothetical protein